MTDRSKLQIFGMSILLAVSCTVSPLVTAQPWYQIEVILFAQNFPNLSASGTTEEVWPKEVELDWQQPLLPMFESEWQVTPALRKLPINSRTMNGDAYAFRVTDGYRLLWHQAWTQPLVDEPDAPWLVIEGGDQIEGHFELEGSLRIHLSRFLHMTANLWLTDFSYPALSRDEPSAEGEPSADREPLDSDKQGQKPTFYLSQLPEKPELYNACSYLRFQPETAVEDAVDRSEQQPVFESWWTAPYECDSPRSNLDRGKPLYAPMLPVIPLETQQISYFKESSEDAVELEFPMPQFSIVDMRESDPNMPGLGQGQAPESEQIFEPAQIEDRPVAQITKINMNRRLRSEEYHFVDHPKLGMLIRILEVEAPAVEIEAATE